MIDASIIVITIFDLGDRIHCLYVLGAPKASRPEQISCMSSAEPNLSVGGQGLQVEHSVGER